MPDRDECSTPRPSRLTREDPLFIVQEAGWAPGPVWTGATSLFLTGIRPPYLPSSGESLYPLRFSSPLVPDSGGVNYKFKIESHITRSTYIHGARGDAVG